MTSEKIALNHKNGFNVFLNRITSIEYLQMSIKLEKGTFEFQVYSLHIF